MFRLLTIIAILLFSGICEAKLSVGNNAPAQLGKDTKSSKEILLQNYTDKVVVIMFWASWCDYCYKTLPVMEAMQEQLGLNSLQVITIAVKDDARAVNKITSEMNPLSIVSSYDKSGKVLSSFGDEYMPNIWVINKAGKIAGHMAVKNDADLIKAIKMVENELNTK